MLVAARTVLAALALTVLAVAVHWNGLGGELSFDDQAAVVSNEDVKQASVLHAGLLYNDFWGKAMDNSFSHKSFRPLVVASFGVNHALHGLEPFGYKVVNVGLHALVTMLLLALFLSISAAQGKADDERHWLVAVGAAALFATHPVHTEVVTGAVVGRAESLCAVFYLLAMLVHVRWPAWSELPVAVCMLLASLSKETGMTLPAVLLAYDALFRWPSVTRVPWRSVRFYTRYGTYALVAAALLAWRVYVSVPWLFPEINGANNHVAIHPSRIVRTLTIAYINARYMLLLVWPRILSADYSVSCIPLIGTPFSSHILVAVAVGAAVVLFLVHAARGRPILLLASLLGLVAFLPASQMLVTAATVIGERLLYLPSAGFVYVLATLLLGVDERRPGGAAVSSTRLAILGAVVAVYAGRTWTRNGDWATTETIFDAAHEACPNSAAVTHSLATRAADAGDHVRAEELHRETLRLFPKHIHATVALAAAVQRRATGNETAVDEAMAIYGRCVSLNPTWVPCWAELGGMHVFRRNVPEAEFYLGEALKRDGTFQSALYNMGNLRYVSDDYDGAVKYYQRSLAVNPRHKPTLVNAAGVLKLLKRYEASLKVYRAYLEIEPNDTSAQENAAWLELVLAETAKAKAKGGKARGV